MASVAVVLTYKDLKIIAEAQGSESWKTELAKARQVTHVVMTRNGHNRWNPSGDNVPHRAAFAVGHVTAIVPSSETEGRWKFKCDKIARLDPPIPDVWEKGRRYPVHYTTFDDLGIKVEDLKFEPIESFNTDTETASPAPAAGGALTIEAAKAGLAKTFNVKPEQIEITVRA